MPMKGGYPINRTREESSVTLPVAMWGLGVDASWALAASQMKGGGWQEAASSAHAVCNLSVDSFVCTLV